MIKLVASDLDGTLLPEGTRDINPEFYDVVRALTDKGIVFVGASGRELETMRSVLRPVEDMIYGISNNGGRVTKHMKENLSMLILDWEVVKAAVEEVRKNEEVLFVSLNTPEGTYTDYNNREILDWLINGYGMKPIVVDDMLCKPLEVMKVSVLVRGDAGDEVGTYIEMFGDRAHVTAAGDKWIDFTHTDADKGVAFTKLIEMLGIKPEETWAFGDNHNDISMIKAAGRGFCAPGGREAVREACDEYLEGDLWDAVINKMKELL